MRGSYWVRESGNEPAAGPSGREPRHASLRHRSDSDHAMAWWVHIMTVAFSLPATAMSGPWCSAATRHLAGARPELLSLEKRLLRNLQTLFFAMPIRCGNPVLRAGQLRDLCVTNLAGGWICRMWAFL
jgi:hypothetical protein